MVPADKAANNVVVVWRLHYVNILKQELSGTKAYDLQISADKRSVVDRHYCHTATKLAVSIKKTKRDFQSGTSVVVPYCYLFLLFVFIHWFTYYVSDMF